MAVAKLLEQLHFDLLCALIASVDIKKKAKTISISRVL